jgi:hypothetical protein
MYSTSVVSWPLSPVMDVPKQAVASEMDASPTMGLSPSSPLVSPQMP